MSLRRRERAESSYENFTNVRRGLLMAKPETSMTLLLIASDWLRGRMRRLRQLSKRPALRMEMGNWRKALSLLNHPRNCTRFGMNETRTSCAPNTHCKQLLVIVNSRGSKII